MMEVKSSNRIGLSFFCRFLFRVPMNRFCICTLTGNLYDGQPPCAYYREGIEIDGTRHKAIEIIAESRHNPCVGVFIQQRYPWQPRILRDDLKILLYARRIVLARGTFRYGVIHVAAVRQFLCTFDNDRPVVAGLCWSCQPPALFRSVVTSHWDNTPEQLSAILSSQSQFWLWITGTNYRIYSAWWTRNVPSSRIDSCITMYVRGERRWGF
jgi:hypothetical protein